MYYSKRILLTLTLLAFSCTPLLAQQYSQHQAVQSVQQNSTNVYNPSVGKISLQFGSGFLLGAGGGLFTGFSAMIIAPIDAQPYNFRPLAYGLSGFYLGYTTLSALGIYIASNSGTHKASFGKTLLGNVIGGAAGYATLFLVENRGIGIATALSAPIVGGIIANSLTIKKRNSRGTTALLNVTNSDTHLSSPSVQLSKVGTDKLPEKIRYAPTVAVLNISF